MTACLCACEIASSKEYVLGSNEQVLQHGAVHIGVVNDANVAWTVIVSCVAKLYACTCCASDLILIHLLFVFDTC